MVLLWFCTQNEGVHFFRARAAEARNLWFYYGFPPKKGGCIFFVRALLWPSRLGCPAWPAGDLILYTYTSRQHSLAGRISLIVVGGENLLLNHSDSGCWSARGCSLGLFTVVPPHPHPPNPMMPVIPIIPGAAGWDDPYTVRDLIV